MNDFLDYIYDKSVELKKGFLITEKKRWNELTVLNELVVQLGHVYTVDCNSILDEKYRNICDLGDEISDVFFQLTLLLFYGKYNKNKIVYNNKSKNLSDFIVCLGQLNEAMLEKYGYRFSKERVGFDSLESYILFKISNLFSIMFNYSISKNIDIYKEFDLMFLDAFSFLSKYKL